MMRFLRAFGGVLRLLFLGALLAILGCQCGALPAAEISRQVIQRATASTVRIHLPGGVGSGSILLNRESDTIILTCAHLFRDAAKPYQSEVEVFHATGANRYPAKVLKGDFEHDVAVLSIQTPQALPVIQISSRKLQRNEDVFNVGCRLGAEPTAFTMEFKGLTNDGLLMCSRYPAQGRSGGGLFDTQGDLVGICVAADRLANRGLYVPREPVYNILNRAGVKLTQRRAQHRGIFYTQSYCAGCEVAKDLLQTDRFRSIGIEWDIRDVATLPQKLRPPWTPAFSLNGQTFMKKEWDADDLHDWMKDTVKQSRAQSSAPLPRESESVIDLPWEGLQFIILVGKEQGDMRRGMSAGVRRLIEHMSGGQATLRVIRNNEAPTIYQAVMDAGQFPYTADLVGVVLVDKVAEVGWIKGKMLAKIENSISERINQDAMVFPIIPVFARSNAGDYGKILVALKTVEPQAEQPTDQPVVPLSPVVEPEQPEDDGSRSVVGMLFGALCVFTGRRIFKHVKDYTLTRDEELQHDLDDKADNEPKVTTTLSGGLT